MKAVKWLVGGLALACATPVAATTLLWQLTGTVTSGFDTGVFTPYPGGVSPLGETVVLRMLLDTGAPGATIDLTPLPNTSELDGGLVSASFTFRGLSYTYGPQDNSRWVKENDDTFPWGVRDGLFGIAHMDMTNTGPFGAFASRGEFQFQGSFPTANSFQTTAFDGESVSVDTSGPDGFLNGEIIVLGAATNPGTFDVRLHYTHVDYLICDGANDPCGLGSTGSSAPEPASWALMIAGFGLAGARLRTRRRPLWA